MSWEIAATAIAGLGNAALSYFGSQEQAKAATEAARIQKEGTDAALALNREQFDQIRNDLAPWRDAGKNALAELQRTRYTPFTKDQFQADPGYQFRLDQGLKAIERSAAARGGLMSGNTERALINYGQQLDSQEFQNAFNRYNTEFGNRLNPILAQTGFGPVALGQMGAAGQNFANNAGAMTMGGANALAGGVTGAANARLSGYVGGANALTNALGTYLNYNQNQSLLNQLARGQNQDDYLTNLLGRTSSYDD